MLTQAIRKKLGKAVKEEKGFTLIELLAVIVILGIIAVIAIPMIGNVISKSGKDSDLATARQVYDAARLYIISDKNGVVPAEVSIEELQKNSYLEKTLYLPSDKSELIKGTVVKYDKSELSEVKLVTSTHTTDKTYTSTQILQAKE